MQSSSEVNKQARFVYKVRQDEGAHSVAESAIAENLDQSQASTVWRSNDRRVSSLLKGKFFAIKVKKINYRG